MAMQQSKSHGSAPDRADLLSLCGRVVYTSERFDTGDVVTH
jgi:hypothetical protein